MTEQLECLKQFDSVSHCIDHGREAEIYITNKVNVCMYSLKKTVRYITTYIWNFDELLWVYRKGYFYCSTFFCLRLDSKQRFTPIFQFARELENGRKSESLLYKHAVFSSSNNGLKGTYHILHLCPPFWIQLLFWLIKYSSRRFRYHEHLLKANKFSIRIFISSNAHLSRHRCILCISADVSHFVLTCRYL